MRNLKEKIMIPAPHNPIEINWNWNKIHCFDYYFFWLHTKIVFLFLSGNRKTLTWFSYPKCIKSFIDLVVCFNICEVKQTQEKATTFFFFSRTVWLLIIIGSERKERIFVHYYITFFLCDFLFCCCCCRLPFYNHSVPEFASSGKSVHSCKNNFDGLWHQHKKNEQRKKSRCAETREIWKELNSIRQIQFACWRTQCDCLKSHYTVSRATYTETTGIATVPTHTYVREI